MDHDHITYNKDGSISDPGNGCDEWTSISQNSQWSDCSLPQMSEYFAGRDMSCLAKPTTAVIMII